MSYALYGISIMIYLSGLLCIRARKYKASNILLSISIAIALFAVAVHVGGIKP